MAMPGLGGCESWAREADTGQWDEKDMKQAHQPGSQFNEKKGVMRAGGPAPYDNAGRHLSGSRQTEEQRG